MSSINKKGVVSTFQSIKTRAGTASRMAAPIRWNSNGMQIDKPINQLDLIATRSNIAASFSLLRVVLNTACQLQPAQRTLGGDFATEVFPPSAHDNECAD